MSIFTNKAKQGTDALLLALAKIPIQNVCLSFSIEFSALFTTSHVTGNEFIWTYTSLSNSRIGSTITVVKGFELVDTGDTGGVTSSERLV